MRCYMHIMPKTYLIIALLTSLYSFGQQSKQIIVIPGLGIVIDYDTIRLAKTKETEVYKLFKMTDTIIEIRHALGCGFDYTGNDISWNHYIKSIRYDGIEFNYISKMQKDSLILEEIEIFDSTHYHVKVNASIVLGKSVPDIVKYFPKQNNSDNYDNQAINLYSYGINFWLDGKGHKKKLSYVSIYKAYRTDK